MVELRYVYGHYQVTAEAYKRAVRNAVELRQFIQYVSTGHASDIPYCLILDDRHFVSYNKKQLLQLTEMLEELCVLCQDFDRDLLIVIRRDMRREVSPVAPIAEHACPNGTGHYPLTVLGKAHYAPMSPKLLKYMESVTLGIFDYTMVVNPKLGRVVNPFELCRSPADIGSVYPMQSSSKVMSDTHITYTFKDHHDRTWYYVANRIDLTLAEATELVTSINPNRIYLETFYKASAEPAKLSREVIDMLLPWGVYIDETLVRTE